MFQLCSNPRTFYAELGSIVPVNDGCTSAGQVKLERVSVEKRIPQVIEHLHQTYVGLYKSSLPMTPHGSFRASLYCRTVILVISLLFKFSLTPESLIDT